MKDKNREEEKTSTEGDLLSNCCAWDFNPFGVEKEDGIYQERCSKCGKLCEPFYMSPIDIKNIRRLETLETNMENDDVIKRFEKEISPFVTEYGGISRDLELEKQIVDFILAEIKRVREECFEQMSEIIGDDERDYNSNRGLLPEDVRREIYARSDLRAEQREKLSKIMEG